MPGEGDPLDCRDPALDDIGHDREYMGRSHGLRAPSDSIFF
jgi:hypothetical protein